MGRVLKEAAVAIAFMCNLLSAAATVYAAYFILNAIGDIQTGPEAIQVILYGVALAIIPYCFAAAIHRAFDRIS